MSLRYDKLTKYIVPNTNVLELACGSGKNQLRSKFVNILDKINYLGLDVIPSDLNSIRVNLFDYQPKKNFYDVILAIEIFEHVKVTSWKELFMKYYLALNEKGLFIITVPHKQNRAKYWKRKHGYQKDIFEKYNSHVVFNLCKKDFEVFLSTLPIHIKLKSKVIISEILFKNKFQRDTTFKAILRYVKRLFIKLSHLSKNQLLSNVNMLLCKKSLLVIVEKEK